MQRLSGLDAAFLALESPTNHLHVMAVAVFDPPPGAFHAALRRTVEERIHLVSSLRRRVAKVPLGLDHPLWVEDARFDLDAHVHRGALVAPGGPAELADFVADVAGRPLDLSRPLWELYIVEGLESGRVAAVAKMHHAAADGLGGLEALACFFDAAPLAAAIRAPGRPWRPEPVPTAAELLGGALGSLVSRIGHGVSTAAATFKTVSDWVDQRGTDAAPPLRRAPRASFNAPVCAQRRFASVEVSLDDVVAVARGAQATVNDVVLAAVGGAMGRWLADRGEEVDDDLVAMVPVATAVGAPPGAANRLSAMFIELGSTISDPIERLLSISARSTAAKKAGGIVPETLVAGWSQLAVPALSTGASRLANALHLVDKVPLPANVVVSNLGALPDGLWCAGARLTSLVPVGPVVDGVGLNVSCTSYDGQLAFGLLGCRELVPDLDAFAVELADSVAELGKAVRDG